MKKFEYNKSAKFAIAELFSSIQGESSSAGKFCFFIRLAGCNLNCKWCDTKYAAKTKYFLTIEEIVEKALKSGAKLVEITGGEPLLNPETPALCKELISKNFTVLLETNGSLPINKLPAKLKIILDCKCPSSGENFKMLFANFAKIKAKDEIKFVIADKNDYIYAKKIIKKYDLFTKTNHIFFSPVSGMLKPSLLAEWMLEDKSKATLALQLHKIIWGKNVKGK